MFAQPMLAATKEEASDLENQAIGRINRTGQKSDTLKIWRIITKDSIEETMLERQSVGPEEGPQRKRIKVD